MKGIDDASVALPVRIGISRCLLGTEVRYDGTGAASSFPRQTLEGLFEYVDLCPEIGIGMTVPRAPIRLIARDGGVRAVGVADPTVDKTDELNAYVEKVAPRLSDLAGYVFMHNSPSCGVHRVKLYDRADAPPRRSGRGIFAAGVMERFPDLPVEDAGRLFDDVLRENFVTRVFTYAHWRSFAEEEITAKRLIAFHSAYKYLLMAHDQQIYKRCGRLLSDLSADVAQISAEYLSLLMQGLTRPATRGSHANVLAHLQGYFKKHLDSESRQELDALVQAFRRGEQPLLAPLTLLKHHLRNYPHEYLSIQRYLQPHPDHAGLRRSL